MITTCQTETNNLFNRDQLHKLILFDDLLKVKIKINKLLNKSFSFCLIKSFHLIFNFVLFCSSLCRQNVSKSSGTKS